MDRIAQSLTVGRSLRQIFFTEPPRIGPPASSHGQMPTPVDDSELVERALSGDREAFRMLLDRHYERMVRMAYRIVGSTAEAEDIAQDVCLRLVDKLAYFGNRSRFSTWLASVVVNTCRDALRRRKSTE